MATKYFREAKAIIVKYETEKDKGKNPSYSVTVEYLVNRKVYDRKFVVDSPKYQITEEIQAIPVEFRLKQLGEAVRLLFDADNPGDSILADDLWLIPSRIVPRKRLTGTVRDHFVDMYAMHKEYGAIIDYEMDGNKYSLRSYSVLHGDILPVGSTLNLAATEDRKVVSLLDPISVIPEKIHFGWIILFFALLITAGAAVYFVGYPAMLG